MTLDERAKEYTKEAMEWCATEGIKIKQAFKDGFIQGEESKDLHWHTPEEIPTNEEGKPYTVNVLNNHYRVVYYDFYNNCWVDDYSCCAADEFEAWCYLPEYKG